MVAIYAHNQWAGALSATLKITRAPKVPGALPAQAEAREFHVAKLHERSRQYDRGSRAQSEGSWRINLVTIEPDQQNITAAESA
jgi:hypothetical protein